MNREILSIETAGKLAKYEKMKKEIKSLIAYVETEIQYCESGGDEFKHCVNDLKIVLEQLKKIDLN